MTRRAFITATVALLVIVAVALCSCSAFAPPAVTPAQASLNLADVRAVISADAAARANMQDPAAQAAAIAAQRNLLAQAQELADAAAKSAETSKSLEGIAAGLKNAGDASGGSGTPWGLILSGAGGLLGAYATMRAGKANATADAAHARLDDTGKPGAAP